MNKNYVLRVMRITVPLLWTGMLSVSAASYSQQITLKGKRIPFTKVIAAIRQQSGYTVFSTKNISELVPYLTVDAKQMDLSDFLKSITTEQPITYQIEDKIISFTKRRSSEVKATAENIAKDVQQKTVTGTVVNLLSGELMTGVTVRLKGYNISVMTDKNGQFSLSIPGDIQQAVLQFSFIGMKNLEVPLKGNTRINVTLEEQSESIKDVVVTGIYQRKKESFTGSSTTYTNKELKMIGNQNVLQSLKTLDPSFAMIDNNQFGSDPNRLPDLEIRGKSSVIGLTSEFGANPNQPLFILDGFESSLSVIRDFSMDRIESITILKDAAATAIYGSKAANGVIVVETKRPAAGQLRLSYNANTSLNFADLSDYNLMNSAEKLQFEKLSLFYGSLDPNGNIMNEEKELLFNNRMKEVAKGVNTYWPNEPLRTVLSQTHTLFAEGGDANLRYSASLSHGANKGIMKGSSRDVTNGNIRLLYRKGRLSFSNSLSIDHVATNREPVTFSRFVRANPYHRKYNTTGGIDKLMESFQYLDINTFTIKSLNIYNPLYDWNNTNVDKSSSLGFTNNFEIDWRIIDELRFRTRIGLRQLSDHGEVFRSPFNSEFADTEVLRQGYYSENNGKQINYDADVSLTYGKLLKEKHMVNFVGGIRVDQGYNLFSNYQVEGFVDDEFSNPTFGFRFPEGSRPGYREAKRRGASAFLNTGYTYDERYLLDATLRSDGSSVYGADKNFTTIWSVGLAWNLHKEQFIQHTLPWISLFKLRGSIGTPGNQNFNDYISMRIYRYNNDNRNPFGSSVIMNSFGNSGLKWQKTLDRNIGFDLELLHKRLRFNFDYFNKNTDPLLVFIGLPSSTGTSSVAKNIGSQTTKGLTLVTDYAFVQRENFNWHVNLNLRHITSGYHNIGNSLDKFNQDNKSRNLIRYYDNASPSDLWAVRSAGIDPATGREIFLNKNGQQTFLHDFNNEVVVGNSDPKVEGIIGTSFYYKGFSGAINLRYRLGGQEFMQTLYEKVENINIQNIALNQDKRALYDRWQKPGDIAKFRAISQTDVTPISSRFVEDNNILSGESISFGYETMDKKWLKKIGASSLTSRIYMNDIFRISTIKNERGIDYPFARSVSLSLGLRF